MKRSFPLLLGVASLVVAADRWTKNWATIEFEGREPVQVIGEIVRFTYTLNSGVAFGLGAGLKFPFAIFSFIAVAVILYLFLRQREHSPSRQWALALILGGAVGNLIDRVRTGEVVDFILVGWRGWYWPVFNVADSAVTIGVLLFGITWARHTEGAQDSDASVLPAAVAPDGAPSTVTEVPHVAPDRDRGTGTERGGAAGSLPGAGAGGPVA